MPGINTPSDSSVGNCGIFEVSFRFGSDLETTCIKMYSILIGGTALPLCSIILVLVCVICCTTCQRYRRKRNVDVSEEGIAEQKKYKRHDTKPDEDKSNGQPKCDIEMNATQNKYAVKEDDIEIDAGLYDSIDIIDQLKSTQELANTETDLDGDNYDYISNNQQGKRAPKTVPKLSSSRGNDEARPYEEFVKQEQPVYALPNKQHKSKSNLTEDSDSNNGVNHLHLGFESTPANRNSAQRTSMCPDLASLTHQELADDSSGPPLPPPIAPENIPTAVNNLLQVVKIETAGNSNKRKSHHEDLNVENATLYKNAHQHMHRSMGQLVHNVGKEALYYNTASRDKLISSASDLHDQPPKINVEPSEVHEQLYMNV